MNKPYNPFIYPRDSQCEQTVQPICISQRQPVSTNRTTHSYIPETASVNKPYNPFVYPRDSQCQQTVQPIRISQRQPVSTNRTTHSYIPETASVNKPYLRRRLATVNKVPVLQAGGLYTKAWDVSVWNDLGWSW